MDVGCAVLDVWLHHSGVIARRLGLVVLGGWYLYAVCLEKLTKQAVIPLYSAYLAYSTFTGARQSMAGLAGSGGNGEASAGQGSKRQQKMEKRGGQKVQYR